MTEKRWNVLICVSSNFPRASSPERESTAKILSDPLCKIFVQIHICMATLTFNTDTCALGCGLWTEIYNPILIWFAVLDFLLLYLLFGISSLQLFLLRLLYYYAPMQSKISLRVFQWLVKNQQGLHAVFNFFSFFKHVKAKGRCQLTFLFIPAQV